MTETVKKLRKPGTATVRPAKSPKAERVVQTFRALSKLTVADGDGIHTHERVFGDFVPEAEQWKNVALYLKQGLLEKISVNQSQIDEWREEYEERIAAEDAEKDAALAEEQELAELKQRMAELEAKKTAKSEAPAPKKAAVEDLEGEQTIVEKIDLGGVKSKHTGMPRPVALPTVRNTTNLPNVGEARKAPTKVLRKKG
jgi:transposase-like protein